jgi:hypothetical protein
MKTFKLPNNRVFTNMTSSQGGFAFTNINCTCTYKVLFPKKIYGVRILQVMLSISEEASSWQSFNLNDIG